MTKEPRVDLGPWPLGSNRAQHPASRVESAYEHPDVRPIP